MNFNTVSKAISLIKMCDSFNIDIYSINTSTIGEILDCQDMAFNAAVREVLEDNVDSDTAINLQKLVGINRETI